MFRGILKKPDGATLIEFDIPSSLSELKLNRFIDFLIECRAMDNDDVNHAEAITKAVGAFTGAPIADIVKTNFETYTENGLIDCVSKVFAYALKLVSEAKGNLIDPSNPYFEYKGKVFVIPTILSQALAGEVILPGLSTIEVIEVAEVNRFKHQTTQQRGDPDGALRKKIFDMFTDAVSVHGDKNGTADDLAKQTYAKEVEKRGDPDGSLLFTNYIKTLAILCRCDGENLPIEDSAREVWIQNRAVFFSDIDTATALNIDFFLTSILRSYEKEVPVVGFLSRQSFAAVAAMWLKKGKRTKGKRHIAKGSLKKLAGAK